MSTFSFSYTAVDRKGEKCSGVARGASEVDAFRQITAAGLTPVKIRQVRTRSKSRGVGLKDVAHFTYQLSVLISARVPIGDGMKSIGEQEPPGKFRDVIFQIAAKIEAGGRIAEAMAEHTDVFGDLYIQTVRAAEETGNMVKVLEYLSDMLERTLETRQQVRSALMYPMCVVGTLMLAVTFLIGFVIPKFAKMFQEKNVELPIFTKLLMWFGQSMQAYWYVYLILLFGAVVGVRKAWRTEKGRWMIEDWLHKVPVLKDIMIGVAVARFSRVFGLCLNSGLGLIDALHMAGRASARARLIRDTDRMIEQVRAGGRISSVLVACQYIPPFAKRMLTSGEESAELTKMCSVIARHYERDTAALTKNISTIIEPVMIVLIAGVVLIVALAIFLPMWNMVNLMG
ncbi:MAG: type II secretion system F family protein [Phycisphaerales bacterium]